MKNELTQELLHELIEYDPSSGIVTWKMRKDNIGNFNQRFSGKIAGNNKLDSNGKTYRQLKLFGKSYYIHRLAWLYMTGSFPKEQIDHINGNGTDNRFENLREATNMDNSLNKRKYHNNKTGGVGWNQSRNKYTVRINDNGACKFLGHFSDFFEAVCVRKSIEYKLNYHENHGSVRPL